MDYSLIFTLSNRENRGLGFPQLKISEHEYLQAQIIDYLTVFGAGKQVESLGKSILYRTATASAVDSETYRTRLCRKLEAVFKAEDRETRNSLC